MTGVAEEKRDVRVAFGWWSGRPRAKADSKQCAGARGV